jgi:hypothetical protein
MLRLVVDCGCARSLQQVGRQSLSVNRRCASSLLGGDVASSFVTNGELRGSSASIQFPTKHSVLVERSPTTPSWPLVVNSISDLHLGVHLKAFDGASSVDIVDGNEQQNTSMQTSYIPKTAKRRLQTPRGLVGCILRINGVAVPKDMSQRKVRNLLKRATSFEVSMIDIPTADGSLAMATVAPAVVVPQGNVAAMSVSTTDEAAGDARLSSDFSAPGFSENEFPVLHDVALVTPSVVASEDEPHRRQQIRISFRLRDTPGLRRNALVLSRNRLTIMNLHSSTRTELQKLVGSRVQRIRIVGKRAKDANELFKGRRLMRLEGICLERSRKIDHEDVDDNGCMVGPSDVAANVDSTSPRPLGGREDIAPVSAAEATSDYHI